MYWYGDIYMANTGLWGMPQNVQPVVVVSDDISNKISPEVNAVPIIADIRQIKLKDYVVIIGDYGLQGKNIAAIERMVLIDKTQIFERIGSLRGTVYLQQIMQAIKSYLVV